MQPRGENKLCTTEGGEKRAHLPLVTSCMICGCFQGEFFRCLQFYNGVKNIIDVTDGAIYTLASKAPCVAEGVEINRVSAKVYATHMIHFCDCFPADLFGCLKWYNGVNTILDATDGVITPSQGLVVQARW